MQQTQQLPLNNFSILFFFFILWSLLMKTSPQHDAVTSMLHSGELFFLPCMKPSSVQLLVVLWTQTFLPA